MTNKNYTTTFTVDKSPAKVFAAINNVRGWWSGEIDGRTDQLGAEFTYRYQDLHRSTQKITELVPGKKVIWHVKDAAINFVKDKAEWNGTDVVFEIAKKGDQDRTALHPCRPTPGHRMLRQVRRRLGLLHQRQPAQPDRDRQGRPEREGRLNESLCCGGERFETMSTKPTPPRSARRGRRSRTAARCNR